jgi:pimeloyl-ACP methyl ester carboxylesterase
VTETAGSIEIGGRRLGWQSHGAGAPLLLVNGYAATAADWDPGFLDALAESHRVVCPDNRGFGSSELGDLASEPLGVDSMAADLEAVLDALGVERLPVAGWSLGGFVAQQLALRAPRRVERLVLLSTDPGGGAVAADPEAWAQLTDRSGTPREQASRLIALLFPADVAPGIDEHFGDLVAAARAALDPAALSAQEAAMDEWHATEQPPPGDDAPPALVACGSDDAVIPPANADILAARRRCRAERFDGCGHAFMAQVPERLAAMIADFLDNQP